MQLAPFAQPDGEFDPGSLEVNVEGDQREPFLIHQTAQFVDITVVDQKRILLGGHSLILKFGQRYQA